MADIYKIAVGLSLSSNHAQVLGALSQALLHAHVNAEKLQGSLSRVKLAVGGGLALAGGVAGLSLLGKMVDKGNDLVKVQQNMAQAGVKATEIQEAYAKAWEMTKKYQNVGAAEIMNVINEARMTFGSQADATHHVEDFVRMISFLKAFQGGKHAGGAGAFAAEANAAMKSGEIAGKISPEDMAEHVKQLTAMRVAYGEQLKITQYLTAQRAAGVALRNTSDEFRYGMFPALVQENGPGAGTMLMTAFNKIVAGTGNRTKSLEHMAEIGLLKPEMLEYNKMGMVKGLKDPSAIMNNRDAAMNFGDWVMKTLKPLLDKQTTDPIRQAQLISAMFPDRNAAKAITEVLQQFTKLSKDAAQMAIARKSLDEGAYVDKSWEGQKQAFHEQWENFVQALGAPIVGQATEGLKRINEALSGLSQWGALKENAGTIEAIAKGIGVLGVALVGGGGVAILAALGPAGWIAAGIVGLGAACVAFKPQLDQADKAFSDAAVSFGKWLGEIGTKMGEIATAIGTEIMSWPGKLAEVIAGMGAAIVQAIKNALGSLNPFSKTAFEGGEMGGLIHKASFGGGANDNFGGSGSVAAAIGRGTAARGGGISASDMRNVHPDFAAHIRSSALAQGIDPNIALRIANSEGLRGSTPNRLTPGDYENGRPTSFGPFQLHYGRSGGLGNRYTRETGHHASDPRYWQEQIDFALKVARKEGWGAWYGRKGAGVGIREGIGTVRPQAPAVSAPPSKKQEDHITHVHLDGKVIAKAVTSRMASAAKYPNHIGGMDTHGGWRPPGTTLTDAA